MEKMDFKFLPDVSKMIPKCSTQLKEVKSAFKSGLLSYTINNKKNFRIPLHISQRIYNLNNEIYQKNDPTKSLISYDSDDKK